MPQKCFTLKINSTKGKKFKNWNITCPSYNSGYLLRRLDFGPDACGF